MEYLLNQVEKNSEDFEKYVTRLAFIRTNSYMEEMRAKNVTLLEYDLSTEKGRSDMLSDTTSTIGSTMTRSSQVSKSTGLVSAKIIALSLLKKFKLSKN